MPATRLKITETENSFLPTLILQLPWKVVLICMSHKASFLGVKNKAIYLSLFMNSYLYAC